MLCDAFVCDCMGYSLKDVPYITMAEKLGTGSTDTAHAMSQALNSPTEATANYP